MPSEGVRALPQPLACACALADRMAAESGWNPSVLRLRLQLEYVLVVEERGLCRSSVSFRFPLAADGTAPGRSSTKDALVRQLLVRQIRDYVHQVCHALGLSTPIAPHQLRHTYGTEMLRAGVGFPALMKLLGHISPKMTMRY